jgi:hypothetical protein
MKRTKKKKKKKKEKVLFFFPGQYISSEFFL